MKSYDASRTRLYDAVIDTNIGDASTRAKLHMRVSYTLSVCWERGEGVNSAVTSLQRIIYIPNRRMI